MRALEAPCKHLQQRCLIARQTVLLAQGLTSAKEVWGEGGREPAAHGCHGGWPSVHSSALTAVTFRRLLSANFLRRGKQRGLGCVHLS
jgi:hypothetical protein